MLGEVESCTEWPPQNISDWGPRDTGYMPIHQSEALVVLCLFFCLIFPVGLELYHL